MNDRQRIAVIGSGISGLASAWLLNPHHHITLFESSATLGGHTNTVDVHLEGLTHPVDTGFLVYNVRTYPNLIALFNTLGVESVETDMSLSVSLENPRLEWAGSNLATLFGQKRNWVRGAFWVMLYDILRFNKECGTRLNAHVEENDSLKDFLEKRRYSKSFCEWYLLPMAAAIWSCPTGETLNMPFITFVRFCQNHGLLQIFNRPKWRTVKGGAREYVKRMAAELPDVRLQCAITQVTKTEHGFSVTHAAGTEVFDQVVMACHSDQTLAILGDSANAEQRAALAAIRYQPNLAILHTDAQLLPRRHKLWSAWNYFSGVGTPGGRPVEVSYLINRLQPLPFKAPVVVTLNPLRAPDQNKIMAQFHYAHPVLDAAAIAAQKQLDHWQGQGGLWLAGAWTAYGFHEDGLKSALRVVNGMGLRAPWQEDGSTTQNVPLSA